MFQQHYQYKFNTANEEIKLAYGKSQLAWDKLDDLNNKLCNEKDPSNALRPLLLSKDMARQELINLIREKLPLLKLLDDGVYKFALAEEFRARADRIIENVKAKERPELVEAKLAPDAKALAKIEEAHQERLAEIAFYEGLI
jgi:hypothetical protein